MSVHIIVAESLTTFNVDEDGMFVNLNVLDGAGEPSTLVLPAQCLNQLLMSIPKMIQKAIQNRYKDDALRLVYALKEFNVELGETNTAGVDQFILTLATAEGFSVSFSASEQQLTSMGATIAEDVQPHTDLPPPTMRYS
jgi:hypothetical protein